jgi:hypothetical protein
MFMLVLEGSNNIICFVGCQSNSRPSMIHDEQSAKTQANFCSSGNLSCNKAQTAAQDKMC